ncbi:DUF3575 domain-containing protein [candidate division WOR-3 bacterium]|uniref:DUF3575 domain-containing protein n=1 Tax=candidate division WOR-3 bacterium TaxID=2052148 RepID=A0A9D5K7K0_UNCW3|nr:DUF3575 domain-containing protein [candidate division WOR-3 bacterium]MBD3363722.1 DUF3575 domain-containing protein [candidate division WOR-3 bacterium]
MSSTIEEHHLRCEQTVWRVAQTLLSADRSTPIARNLNLNHYVSESIMKLMYLLVLISIWGTVFASAPDTRLETSITRRLSVGINPLKPFMGLPNIELEYQLIRRFSVHAFTEYWAYNTFLSPDETHPDLVIRTGPRYYFYSPVESANVSGFFAGIPLGYVWFEGNLHQSALTLGAELGYKFLLGKRFYALPRGLLTYPLDSDKILPGFEILLGVRI